MARTNRPASVADAPAASVDALDALNLDDMFDDGDDTLFDGLEIDLDMGELPSGPSETRGQEGLVSTTTSEPSDAPKRRTTKRKIKAPPPIDNDDDEYLQLPKKKRRPTKSTAKKTKATNQGAKASKQKGPNTAVTMPLPFSRVSGDTVASVGRFGGASQKKGPYDQLGRQNSKGRGRASPSSGSTISFGDPHPQSASTLPEPRPEGTFCGLKPSRTDFYPFMEAMPVEPSLKKAHRQYPLIYGIHSASSSSSPSTARSSLAPVSENDPLLRLFLAELYQLQSERTPQASLDVKRANISSNIAVARLSISKVNKHQLLVDFSSLCTMLKRQYDFLNQSLENMQHWCRDHFSPSEYSSTYSGSLTSTNRRSSPICLSRGSILLSLKHPIVKVKVKCPGFKPPKPLIAYVRLPGAVTLPNKIDSSKSKVKRKASSMEMDHPSRSMAPFTEVDEKEVSYANMTPSQRRQHVIEVIAQRAQTLELQWRETQDKRRKASDHQRFDLQKVVDDDEILNPNTMTMWKWLEKSPYFTDFSASHAFEILESIWESDVEEDCISLSRMSPRTALVCPSENGGTPLGRSAEPADSIFVRLQSLLVDEGSDDDDEEDNGEEGFVFVRETRAGQPTTVLDLSELSLEKRACIHLRAVGLIEDIRIVSSLSQSLCDEAADEGDLSENDEKDVDSVIRSMQTELIALRRLNNSRVGFLESAVRSHLLSANEMKKKEKENDAMVSRYNQLLKKQKEAKRSTRVKPVKKDGDWVPW